MTTICEVPAKLSGGWTLEVLPVSAVDPLWDEVRNTCKLTGPELSLLKKEVARLARLEAGGCDNARFLYMCDGYFAYFPYIFPFLYIATASTAGRDSHAQRCNPDERGGWTSRGAYLAVR